MLFLWTCCGCRAPALPGFTVVNTVNIQLSPANSWGGTHIIPKPEGRTVQTSLKLLIARFSKCSQSLFLRSVCSAQRSTAYQFFILHLLDSSSSLILSYNASRKFRVVWESVFGIFSHEWVKITGSLFWFSFPRFSIRKERENTNEKQHHKPELRLVQRQVWMLSLL